MRTIGWLGIFLVIAQGAWAGPGPLDARTAYDVSYQASEGKSETLRGVRVLDIALIGTQEFLVVELLDRPQAVRGYISLRTITALLSAGSLTPARSE